MEKQKLGGGIITISVIYFIFLGFGLIGTAMILPNLDTINSTYTQMGLPNITSTELIISLILSALLVISLILILLKKKFGVYSFFTLVAINIIYSLVMNGFTTSTIVSALSGLILPGLLAYFIIKKKEIFGFETKDSNINL